MTIFLVLGLFAGLYMLWLLFSLAVYALPLYAGIGLAFWMRGVGFGYAPSILAGFAAGFATLFAGQMLFTLYASPLMRLAVALLFAVPAGVAGYHAVHGVMGLAIVPGATLTVLSSLGAALIAGTAWTRLAGLEAATLATAK
ncbi:hypothetical protein GGQ88_003834 [Novosphingobium hassiacum]|uniref:DUF4175 domain-containing protein n=1 Tax=Novosphingobium hassiacum TaxID=173676 RepID=A0A7W6EXM8_9SPHN|nr:hypothetical protein [Novosphingobium hassiacum]MBB3862533.1 hypothetical protein [Novosphingobium hassiacum]